MKISVIMSVYNREDYIKTSIESILNQTFKDFELIIIDDNSSDKTVELINEFVDDRIVLIKNFETKGLTKNLNYALSLCKGEYIARMDDDDICFRERFYKEVEYLDSHPEIDVVFSQGVFIGEKTGKVSLMIDDSAYIADYIKFRNSIIHPSVMFRNKRRIEYDVHYIKSQDFELWSRLMLENQVKFGYISEPLIYYRIHPSQTKVSVQNQYAMEILRRNYLLMFEEIDERILEIHFNLLGCQNSLLLTGRDLNDFYRYFIKRNICKNRFLKLILLIELCHISFRQSIKSNIWINLGLTLLNPRYLIVFVRLVKQYYK